MSSRDQPDLTGDIEKVDEKVKMTPPDQIPEVYELDKCQKWIRSQSLVAVSLQFPDSLLTDAPEVTRQLKCRLGDQKCSLYILGDTTYGECCVDEIAAEHVSSDSVIHFGHTCLTPTCRLPALWIFTRKYCDVDCLKQRIEDQFAKKSVILIYDVELNHLLCNFNTDNVEIINGVCETNGDNNDNKVFKFGRTFDVVKSEEELRNKVVVYVGKGESSLMNFIYNWPENEFFVFEKTTLVPAEVPIAKFMMKRYFLVEKTKDAERIGLLVGTLGTEKYTEIIEKLKKIGKKAKKKVYVFLVGKPNVAKLANFPEIDVFVMVACPETSMIDARDFLQPIVTPFEFELACNKSVEWSGRLVTDYRELLKENVNVEKEDGKDSSLDDNEEEGDMSLITGKIRASCNTNDDSTKGQLTIINDKTVR